MNYYKERLKDKKEYQHNKPKDKIQSLKKTKIDKMKKVKKNAQLGMF